MLHFHVLVIWSARVKDKAMTFVTSYVYCTEHGLTWI